MDEYPTWYNAPVCHYDLPHNVHVYVSHGPVILPCILKVSVTDLNCFERLSDGDGICAPPGTCSCFKEKHFQTSFARISCINLINFIGFIVA